MPLNIPSIDYTSRDWASIRQSLLDDAANRLPEWVNRDANDFGMMLIEAFAYIGDTLSYYTDRLADEAYISTARNRASILNLADMLGYRPDNGQPSTVLLTIGVLAGTGRVRIPAGTQFSTVPLTDDLTSIVVFETDTDLYIDQDSANVMYGTVSATQGETVSSEVLGLSDGTPAQVFTLLQSPAVEQTVRVFVDEGAGPLEWMFFEHLIDAQPTALAYTTRTDAFGRTAVYFGDDVNGRVPFSGAAVTATYRVGGGFVGNVGANTITNIMSAGPGVNDVNNLGPATGGTDVESNDQIRVNAPRSLSTLKRAVSLEDYGNICLNVVGVAKANAFGLTPNNVTVWVAPSGGGVPTQQLKQRVSTYLSDKKVGPTAQVIVSDPAYVPVNVTVDVMVKPEYGQAAVLNAVKNALIDMLDFAAVDFGVSLAVSDVYTAMASVDGVQFAGVRVLSRGSDTGLQAANNLDFGPNEIPTATGGIFTVQPFSGLVLTPTTPPSNVVPGQPGAPVIDSVSCPTSSTMNGAFSMLVHWNAADNATGYQVVIDFYHGTTYRGTVSSDVVAATSAVVNKSFYGDADTMKVRVVAINSLSKTDGPTTSAAYACGTNQIAPPTGTGDLPTALHYTSVTLGAQDAYGNIASAFAVAWTNGVTLPAKLRLERQYVDQFGAVVPLGHLTSDVAGTATTFVDGSDQVPRGAITMQVRLGILDASRTVVQWTDWVGTSVATSPLNVTAYTNWRALPTTPVLTWGTFTRQTDGTVTGTINVTVDNWQDIRYDWWWQDANGYAMHSATPSDDFGFLGGGGIPANHFSGAIPFTTNAPAPDGSHTPVQLVVRVTGLNPFGSGQSTLIQHSY